MDGGIPLLRSVGRLVRSTVHGNGDLMLGKSASLQRLQDRQLQVVYGSLFHVSSAASTSRAF